MSNRTSSTAVPTRVATVCLFMVTLGSAACSDDEGTPSNNNNNNNNQNISTVCGDSVVGTGEQCDHGALNSDNEPNACRTNCMVAHCGDGVIDASEVCDEAALGGESCAGLGYTKGSLRCSDICEYDLSDCTRCGNNQAEGSNSATAGYEACDGSDLRGHDCISLNEAAGIVTCSSACEFDVTGCTGVAPCGNGVLDDGEICDAGADNSNAPNATCRDDCTPRTCGDGIPDDLFGEACDDASDNANTPNATCRSNCLLPTCGDGILDNLLGEGCDDATDNSNDPNQICRTDCTTQRCGDGIIDDLLAEECDDGTLLSDLPNILDACRTDCTPQRCGDGIIDDAINNEECDDGTALSDAPNAACRTDCSAQTCGDLIIDDLLGEDCDDADATDWNGCRDCQIVEFQVNTEWNWAQTLPDVAVNASGAFVIVWQSSNQDGDGAGVYGQRYDSLGYPVGSEFQVNTVTAYNQNTPSVAMAPDGSFVVAFSSPDGVSAGVFVRRYDSTGNPLEPEYQIDADPTTSTSSQQVAMASDGSFVVAWSSWDIVNGSNVYMRRANATGTPLGGNIKVHADSTEDQFRPAVSMTVDGTLVVAWTSYDAGGDLLDIHARRFDPTGAPVGAEFLVNSTSAGDQDYAAVGTASDGSFVIAWQSLDADNWGIFGQRFNRHGSPISGEFPVNTTTTGVQKEPAVSMGANGQFVVVWESSDGDGLGVFAQLFSSAGALVGNESQINVYTSGGQERIAVSMGASGVWVTVWDSSLQDGSFYGIFARRYTSDGTPVPIGQ